MTQQLERDLQRAFAEIEKNTFEIRLLKDITLIDSSAILSESSKSSDNSDWITALEQSCGATYITASNTFPPHYVIRKAI